MNKVILMGRIVRDPEVRYSQNNENSMTIARFTLAVERKGSRNEQNGDQLTADFIHCIAFKKQAEVIEKYCRQGTKLLIEGHWQTGNYTNKDGQKVYTNECIVQNVEFAESKSSSSSGSNSSDAAPSYRPEPDVSGDGFMNIPDGVEDEGLPFN